jgi:hypothetical protein
MSAKCLNLRDLFGAKYRVTHEESRAADRGDHTRVDDPWTMLVLCEHGHVGAYGDNELYASTNRSGSVAMALRNLDCCRVWMDGSDGLNVVFDVTDAKKVLAVMKPRRRRQLSPEQKARLVEMGRANLERINRPHVQDAPNERQQAQAALRVQTHQEQPDAILALN